MQQFNASELKKLYRPPLNSHKGQNGRLLVIGGSRLFHSAGLWAVEVASKIVDLVFFASVPINLTVMSELKIKGLFRNGIAVPAGEVEKYLQEADAVLIGCGMERQNQKPKTKNQKHKLKIKNIKEIEDVARSEGERTRLVTEFLLKKYPKKKWVIDGGALQEMEREWIPAGAILTPHRREFERLFGKRTDRLDRTNMTNRIDRMDRTNRSEELVKMVAEKAKRYNCVILLKGRVDVVGNMDGEVKVVKGGNAGMTKGGSGDVLAGLVAALYCKNEPFLSACAGSLINKMAGDSLYKRVGPYFNASDLLGEIPRVMGKLTR